MRKVYIILRYSETFSLNLLLGPENILFLIFCKEYLINTRQRVRSHSLHNKNFYGKDKMFEIFPSRSWRRKQLQIDVS